MIVDAAACPSWINGGCELQSAPTNGFYLAGACVRGLSCMCQGYTSLVSLEDIRGDRVQGIPCGSAARNTLRDHRGPPHA